MKYLALDTNIYLDMVVSRNKSHKTDSYIQMKKLLDYGELRLIVPKIVITEVKRHLDQEIEKIHGNLKRIKKSVDELYWINNVVEMELFKEKIPNVKQGIKHLNELFENKKKQYINDANELFDSLFAHKNVLVIEETNVILYKASLRKLHKKRPYHYKQTDKDSMADAVIIETLIEVINGFNRDDQIFFISRNTEDFSDETEKSRLHKDIQEDIDLLGLTNQFYYKNHFTKTIIEDFKEEADHVGLLEELNKEIEREMIEELEYEEIERNREAGGLTSLSANWDEIIQEESKILDLMGCIEDCRSALAARLEDYADNYDALINKINNLDLMTCISAVSNFNSVEAGCFTLSNNLDEMKDEILDLVNERIKINPEDYAGYEMWRCEETFIFNDVLLEFEDFDNQIFKINVQGELIPENGGRDIIEIKIDDDILNQTEIGIIEVSYGYLNFEDDNVADGLQQEININIDNIIEATQGITEHIERQLHNDDKTLEYLKNSLGL